MAPAATSVDVFPSLVCCAKVADIENGMLFDVKFYPYPTAENELVFAVAGQHHVFVCRLTPHSDPPFEVLRWFRGSDGGTRSTGFNSLVWTTDSTSKTPQLCVAGENPKQIQILDIVSGQHARTLVGHGNSINDLAISPTSTTLLASASADYTVRLWDLALDHKAQPCVAIFAGDGHRQPVLACQFHPDGRWLLTAGLDTAICLWAVPDKQELEQHRHQQHDSDHPSPVTVHYPHFHSTEVHANYVDCVTFYGDLILSRSARDPSAKIKSNEILLWKIDGFHSEDPPPTEPPTPEPGVWTRSSFPHGSSSRGFQRLLTFDMPSTTRFYLRFSLLHQAGIRPILAMGNEASKFLFWDLQKLEEGYEPSEDKSKPKKSRHKNGGAGAGSAVSNAVNESNLDRLAELRKGGGPSNEVLQAYGTPDPSSTSVSIPPERKYDLGDPFVPLKAHKTILANTALSAKRNFATTQLAWSPDGKWLVGVGDYGMMCFFRREVV